MIDDKEKGGPENTRPVNDLQSFYRVLRLDCFARKREIDPRILPFVLSSGPGPQVVLGVPPWKMGWELSGSAPSDGITRINEICATNE